MHEDSDLRKSILSELGLLGSKHTVKVSRGTWHQIQIRERKGPSRGFVQKCALHERSPCAPKVEEKSHEEILIQERCVRKALWDLAKKIYKLTNSDKATFYVPGEAKVMSAPTSKRPEEREFVVDSGASMHMMSKKRIGFGRIMDSKKVENPNRTVDCKRRSAHSRGGTSVRS